MDRVHGLPIDCWFIQKPVSMDTVAAAHDAGWLDWERAYAWQRNFWRLVDVRNQCGDFNERFHVAALPTGQTSSSCGKTIIRTPAHCVRCVQTFQRVMQCKSITQWNVPRWDWLIFRRVNSREGEVCFVVTVGEQDLQEI